MNIAGLVSAVAIGLSPPNSDPINITTGTDVHPIFEEGKLVGCEATFAVIRAVTTHDAGGPIALNGSLAVMAWPGRERVLGIKIGALKTDGTRIAPHSAGLAEHNQTNIDDLIKIIDITPGYISALYHLNNNTLSSLSQIGPNSVILGYYELQGEEISDDFYIDFRVKNFDPDHPNDATYDYGAGKEFSECVVKLLRAP